MDSAIAFSRDGFSIDKNIRRALGNGPGHTMGTGDTSMCINGTFRFIPQSARTRHSYYLL
ncbi:MAG: hypothetical protein PVH87_10030 [Desulfobacteraceae bacterium]